MKNYRISADLKITDYITREVTRVSIATYVHRGSEEEMAREVINDYIKENKLKDCRVACTYIKPLVKLF